MSQLITRALEWCARMMFPSRGRHIAPAPEPARRQTAHERLRVTNSLWQQYAVNSLIPLGALRDQIHMDEGAFVRAFATELWRSPEEIEERRRQAQRRAILAEAIAAPVNDWTRSARAAGIAA